jgi:hypothetical protein
MESRRRIVYEHCEIDAEIIEKVFKFIANNVLFTLIFSLMKGIKIRSQTQ